MTSLRFRSLDFDYMGTLPTEANAGNQFYGQDVAQFISASLEAAGHKASFIPEDWGWLVSCSLKDKNTLEVAVYNLNEHGEGGKPGAPEWGLWVRHYQAAKRFGFWSYHKEVSVTAEQIQVLKGIFSTKGIHLEPWNEGPEEA